MNLILIIQARMSSKRLPGKVLKKICGKPLLLYILESMQQSKILDDILVVTSRHSSDDKIEDFLISKGISCYRGSLKDVASRFYDVVSEKEPDAFVRICADSPFLDYRLVDLLVKKFLSNSSCDLVTNVFPRTFPKGQSVEVLNSKNFLSSFSDFRTTEQKEHVTKYFYDNSSHFKILNITNNVNLSNYRLTIDTKSDFNSIERIASLMQSPHYDYPLNSIIDFINK